MASLRVAILGHGPTPLVLDVNVDDITAPGAQQVTHALLEAHAEHCGGGHLSCLSDGQRVLASQIWSPYVPTRYFGSPEPHPHLWRRHQGSRDPSFRAQYVLLASKQRRAWPFHLVYVITAPTQVSPSQSIPLPIILRHINPASRSEILRVDVDAGTRSEDRFLSEGNILRQEDPGAVSLIRPEQAQRYRALPSACIFTSHSPLARDRFVSHARLFSNVSKDAESIRSLCSLDPPRHPTPDILLDFANLEWLSTCPKEFTWRLGTVIWDTITKHLRETLPDVAAADLPFLDFTPLVKTGQLVEIFARTILKYPHARCRVILHNLDNLLKDPLAASACCSTYYPGVLEMLRETATCLLDPLAAALERGTILQVLLTGADVAQFTSLSPSWTKVIDISLLEEWTLSHGYTVDEVTQLASTLLDLPPAACSSVVRAVRTKANSATRPTIRQPNFLVLDAEEVHNALSVEIGVIRGTRVEPATAPVMSIGVHVLLARLARSNVRGYCCVALSLLANGKPVDSGGLVPPDVDTGSRIDDSLSAGTFFGGLRALGLVFLEPYWNGRVEPRYRFDCAGPNARKVVQAMHKWCTFVNTLRVRPLLIPRTPLDPAKLPRLTVDLVEATYYKVAVNDLPNCERVFHTRFMDSARLLLLWSGIPIHFAQQEVIVYYAWGGHGFCDVWIWNPWTRSLHVIELKSMVFHDLMAPLLVSDPVLAAQMQDPQSRRRTEEHLRERLRATQMPSDCQQRAVRDAKVAGFAWDGMMAREHWNDDEPRPLAKSLSGAKTQVGGYVEPIVARRRLDTRVQWVDDDLDMHVYESVAMLVGGTVCCAWQGAPRRMKGFPTFVGVSPAQPDDEKTLRRIGEKLQEQRPKV